MWMGQQKTIPQIIKPVNYGKRRVLRIALFIFLSFCIYLFVLSRAGRSIPKAFAASIRKERIYPFVLVTGMHHSMTSVAAKLLFDSPYFYGGQKLELLLRPDNPLKYYEFKRAVRVNQVYFEKKRDTLSIRTSNLHSWLGYGVPLLDLTNQDETDLENAVSKMVRALTALSGSKRIPFIKDPRISLTSIAWLEGVKKTIPKVDISCVILIRDPLESIYRFLADYNNASPLSAKEWASVWEQYTWRALYDCAKFGAHIEIVRHEDYAFEPAKTNERLINNLVSYYFPEVSEIHVSTDLPTEWQSKHLKKSSIWNNIKSLLPFQEKDLLSDKTLQLLKKFDEGNVQEIGEYVLAASPFPSWLPIHEDVTTIYVTKLDENANEMNGKVLIRSITVYDASRRLIAIIDPQRFSPSQELIETYEGLGWDVLNPDNEDFIQRRKVWFDSTSFVIGRTDDNQLKTVSCPKGICGLESLFHAYYKLGGSVSSIKSL